MFKLKNDDSLKNYVSDNIVGVVVKDNDYANVKVMKVNDRSLSVRAVFWDGRVFKTTVKVVDILSHYDNDGFLSLYFRGGGQWNNIEFTHKIV
jgi:F0F1-type ATP synthase beta subunit